GTCYENCRFDAINEGYEIDPFLCEGCGVCAYVCPEDAIRMEDVLSGYSLKSSTAYGKMVHGELNPGEETSGKLVTELKGKARSIAKKEEANLIIVDGSPGTGCPVIASLADVDLALVVTEPTKSGLSDLKRVIGLSENFDIKPAVVINKYDLNAEMVREIESFAGENGIPVLGKIPYDSKVTEAMMQGKSVVKYSENGATQEIKKIWGEVTSLLG
ncbi:4Fe-4S binding protein, partial [Candidatus Bipolaricaulota bacterium]|nr:4Fe-4S binding protein [Candidatus Bipolaricaulota bacterium]